RERQSAQLRPFPQRGGIARAAPDGWQESRGGAKRRDRAAWPARKYDDRKRRPVRDRRRRGRGLNEGRVGRRGEELLVPPARRYRQVPRFRRDPCGGRGL